MEEKSKGANSISQDEIDMLLAGENSEPKENTASKKYDNEVTPEELVDNLLETISEPTKVYDFKRPEGFTRREKKALETPAKELASVFAKAVSGYTNEEARCTFSGFDKLYGKLFCGGKDVFGMYEFRMGEERAFVSLNEKMYKPFLLGKAAADGAELSQTEKRLAGEKIASLFAKSTFSAFGMEQTAADGGIRQIQSVQEYEAHFSDKEEGAVFVFELEFLGLQFRLSLFVPHAQLVSLRDKICPRPQKAPEGVKNTLVCIGGFNMPSVPLVPLEEGQIFELDTMCGEPARVIKDGKVIARAEVLAIEENFGIRITSTADADCESFLLNFYSSLTEKEKDTVAGICKEMVFLAKKSRREGILCLEEGADEIQLKFPDKNGRFMYLLLHCLTEGWNPSSISRIADNYTRSSCAGEFERLCFSIIEEGILSIQAGDSPRIMQERFVSLFGIENEKDFREQTGFAENW